MPLDGSAKDPRFVAAMELIGRTAADSFQIRYSDDEQPIVWMALATYGERIKKAVNYDPKRHVGTSGTILGAAFTPLNAVMALLRNVFELAPECEHCRRPPRVTDDWARTQPLGRAVCWYVFDPELEKFRRDCEGD